MSSLNDPPPRTPKNHHCYLYVLLYAWLHIVFVPMFTNFHVIFAVLLGLTGWLVSRDEKKIHPFFRFKYVSLHWKFVIETQFKFRWNIKNNSNFIVNTKVVCIEATFLADLAAIILCKLIYHTLHSEYSILFFFSICSKITAHSRFITIYVEKRQKNK